MFTQQTVTMSYFPPKRPIEKSYAIKGATLEISLHKGRRIYQPHRVGDLFGVMSVSAEGPPWLLAKHTLVGSELWPSSWQSLEPGHVATFHLTSKSV